MRGARVNNVVVERKSDNREICGRLGRHVVIDHAGQNHRFLAISPATEDDSGVSTRCLHSTASY